MSGQTGKPKPEGDGSWVVRVSDSFTDHRATPLSDKAFRVLMVMERYARAKAFCSMGNGSLARRTGKKDRAIQGIVAELIRSGWICRVTAGGKKGLRIGFVMLRRVNPAYPAADTPEKLQAAVGALLARTKNEQHAKTCVLSMQESAGGVRKFLHAAACKNLRQNKEGGFTPPDYNNDGVGNDGVEVAKSPIVLPARGKPEPSDAWTLGSGEKAAPVWVTGQVHHYFAAMIDGGATDRDEILEAVVDGLDGEDREIGEALFLRLWDQHQTQATIA